MQATIFVFIAVIVVWRIGREQKRKVARENARNKALDGFIAASNRTMAQQHEIIEKQHEFIQALLDARKQTTEKVNELMELLPEAQDQGPNIQEDHRLDSAAVIMFQKLEDAMAAVDRHAPNSALSRELKELLK